MEEPERETFPGNPGTAAQESGARGEIKEAQHLTSRLVVIDDLSSGSAVEGEGWVPEEREQAG